MGKGKGKSIKGGRESLSGRVTICNHRRDLL